MSKQIVTAAAGTALALALGVAACTNGPGGGQGQENKQQAQDTQSLVSAQPLPHFNWSQIRQTAIDTEVIQADGTATTSFFFNMGDPDPVMSCPSLGLPVPNTAQLSNPDQVIYDQGSGGGGNVTIGQMDPNGIYAPSNSSGTSVECVNAGGKPYITYWEGFVYSVTAPAVWDYTHHQVKVTGAPTFNVKTKAATP